VAPEVTRRALVYTVFRPERNIRKGFQGERE
jgi:hypothetical protein